MRNVHVRPADDEVCTGLEPMTAVELALQGETDIHAHHPCWSARSILLCTEYVSGHAVTRSRGVFEEAFGTEKT